MSPRWDLLHAQLHGTLAFAGEPDYLAASPWVVSAPVFTPAAVVTALDADDVVAVIKWAAVNGLRVAVQCTGHHATRIGDDVVLLNTAAMTDLQIDPATRVANFEAGCRWSQILPAAAAHGLTAVTGSAPGVSAVGFLVGGGVGPLSRTLGVGSDYVRAMTVVTGDGAVRRVTPTHEPDLFFGLRGGKASLGIVVSVELELVALESFFGGAVYFAGDDIEPALRRWAPWAAELPVEGNTSAALLQLPADAPVPPPLAGRMVLALRFAWLGGLQAGRDHGETLAGFGAPVFGSIDVMSPADVGAIHADPVDPMPFQDGGFLLHDLPDAATEALLESFGPRSGSSLAFAELRRLGGRIATQPAHRDAFGARRAGWSLWAGSPPGADRTVLVEDLHRRLGALDPWSTGASMPNFLISDDPVDMPRLWSTAAYAELQRLAAEYDPAGLLNVGQVVVR